MCHCKLHQQIVTGIYELWRQNHRGKRLSVNFIENCTLIIINNTYHQKNQRYFTIEKRNGNIIYYYNNYYI